MGFITFYTRAIGSSHIALGKPCQDNGLCYDDNGIQIAIVCDGHGSDSYVRSDIGSKLAAEIAKEEILKFVSSEKADLMKGKKGTVTAVATCDPRIDKHGNKMDVSVLPESQLELLKQNIQYSRACKENPEIEALFRCLFKDICNKWRDAIANDEKENPFSKSEKEKLGSLRLEKAYGTTLMAAIRTAEYWFAFHIGDGKLFSCDRLMQWKEPVPWDCNCFLNFTTSLCDRSPVEEFRYAYDGTGDFPLAFVLGSDGIDDTYIQDELIHKFYSNLLCVFNERETKEAETLLEQSLSGLSKRGSHDDMSVAAIIDTCNLTDSVEYYKLVSEVRSLKAEQGKRKGVIEEKQKELEKNRSLLEVLKKSRDDKAMSDWNWWLVMLKEKTKRHDDYEKLSSEVTDISNKLVSLATEIRTLEASYLEWDEESRKRYEALKEQAEEIKKKIYSENSKTELIQNTLETAPDEEIDSVNDVLKKASQAGLTEEEILELNKQSDAQFKDINNKTIKE